MLEKLPYSLRVLVENVLRHGYVDSIQSFKAWLQNKTSEDEINYLPARVLMQDFTGVPAIVDLASMRDAMQVLGGSPLKINPLIHYKILNFLKTLAYFFQFIKEPQSHLVFSRAIPPKVHLI